MRLKSVLRQLNLMALGCLMMTGQPVRVDDVKPQVKPGETFRVLTLSLGTNYVAPTQVTLEEGWYRVIVQNPLRLGGGLTVGFDDEVGNRLTGKTVDDRSHKTAFYFKVTPGRHKIKIGTKQEWVVDVTVARKAQ